MQQALAQARSSLAAGEFPVGCVITCGEEILTTGARQGTLAGRTSETDHAEMVAFRRLGGSSCGPMAGELVLYTTLEPCLMCFAAAMLHGIGTIVYAYEDVMGGGVRCDVSQLSALYRNHRPLVVPGILRSQSLALFKTYFSDSRQTYWRDSLLSRYTLCQQG